MLSKKEIEELLNKQKKEIESILKLCRAQNVKDQIIRLFQKYPGFSSDVHKKRLKLIKGYAGECIFYIQCKEMKIEIEWNNGSSIKSINLEDEAMVEMDFVIDGRYYIDVKTSTQDTLHKNGAKGFPPGKCTYTLKYEHLKKYYKRHKDKAYIYYIIFNSLNNLKIDKTFAMNVCDTLNSLGYFNKNITIPQNRVKLMDYGSVMSNPDPHDDGLKFLEGFIF